MAFETLFDPFELGDLTLKNRIVMAPLTRNRATHGSDAPHDLNVDYYRQRASAGLIITEATQISPQGKGYVWTPGLYSSEQVEGWRKVTDAVHDAGGRIYVQLWHVGRISHTSLQPDGGAPVAPSAIAAHGKTFLESGDFAEFSKPRALEAEEIPGIVRTYLNAAENAERAGFDGVELHAANGYLLDQFLRNGANKRTDAYGGSIDNRTRLVIEVLLTLCRVFPKERVGIRLSPVSHANDLEDSDPQPLFDYLVREMDALKIGYMHMIEGETQGPRETSFDFAKLRKAFRGAYMANNGYTPGMAAEAVSSNKADLVAFGRPYISNPDLPERIRADASLAKDNKDTWYGGGAEGYTDYPTMSGGKA